jgi:hypothetical protein
MSTHNIAALILVLIISSASGQQPSPTETVISFYRALKDKRYAEGFGLSVYREALQGLTPQEMQELEPEFLRTFSAIPDKIEPRGENIIGDSAIVFLKFEGVNDLQQVVLTRVAGQWLVGDKESLTVVKAQGRRYFLNARIAVNENEAFEVVSRIVDAETLYAGRFEGRRAALEELIKRGAVPKELESGELNGYAFAVKLSDDQKSFSVTATPVVYGKTGRLSFYADVGGIRAEDRKGKPATGKSPVFNPN